LAQNISEDEKDNEKTQTQVDNKEETKEVENIDDEEYESKDIFSEGD
jgi:hypothetical protein